MTSSDINQILSPTLKRVAIIGNTLSAIMLLSASGVGLVLYQLYFLFLANTLAMTDITPLLILSLLSGIGIGIVWYGKKQLGQLGHQNFYFSANLKKALKPIKRADDFQPIPSYLVPNSYQVLNNAEMNFLQSLAFKQVATQMKFLECWLRRQKNLRRFDQVNLLLLTYSLVYAVLEENEIS